MYSMSNLVCSSKNITNIICIVFCQSNFNSAIVVYYNLISLFLNVFDIIFIILISGFIMACEILMVY